MKKNILFLTIVSLFVHTAAPLSVSGPHKKTALAIATPTIAAAALAFFFKDPEVQKSLKDGTFWQLMASKKLARTKILASIGLIAAMATGVAAAYTETGSDSAANSHQDNVNNAQKKLDAIQKTIADTRQSGAAISTELLTLRDQAKQELDSAQDKALRAENAKDVATIKAAGSLSFKDIKDEHRELIDKLNTEEIDATWNKIEEIKSDIETKLADYSATEIRYRNAQAAVKDAEETGGAALIQNAKKAFEDAKKEHGDLDASMLALEKEQKELMKKYIDELAAQIKESADTKSHNFTQNEKKELHILQKQLQRLQDTYTPTDTTKNAAARIIQRSLASQLGSKIGINTAADATQNLLDALAERNEKILASTEFFEKHVDEIQALEKKIKELNTKLKKSSPAEEQTVVLHKERREAQKRLHEIKVQYDSYINQKKVDRADALLASKLPTRENQQSRKKNESTISDAYQKQEALENDSHNKMNQLHFLALPPEEKTPEALAELIFDDVDSTDIIKNYLTENSIDLTTITKEEIEQLYDKLTFEIKIINLENRLYSYLDTHTIMATLFPNANNEMTQYFIETYTENNQYPDDNTKRIAYLKELHKKVQQKLNNINKVISSHPINKTSLTQLLKDLTGSDTINDYYVTKIISAQEKVIAISQFLKREKAIQKYLGEPQHATPAELANALAPHYENYTTDSYEPLLISLYLNKQKIDPTNINKESIDTLIITIDPLIEDFKALLAGQEKIDTVKLNKILQKITDVPFTDAELEMVNNSDDNSSDDSSSDDRQQQALNNLLWTLIERSNAINYFLEEKNQFRLSMIIPKLPITTTDDHLSYLDSLLTLYLQKNNLDINDIDKEKITNILTDIHQQADSLEALIAEDQKVDTEKLQKILTQITDVPFTDAELEMVNNDSSSDDADDGTNHKKQQQIALIRLLTKLAQKSRSDNSVEKSHDETSNDETSDDESSEGGLFGGVDEDW